MAPFHGVRRHRYSLRQIAQEDAAAVRIKVVGFLSRAWKAQPQGRQLGWII